MFVTVIIAAIIGLIAALVGSMIALGIQRRSFAKTLLEHEAWERAQESQQHSWEAQQEKRSLAQEHKLASQIQQIQSEWQDWKTKDAKRAQELSAQYTEAAARLNLEKDLSRLPYIEETPLPSIASSKSGDRSPYPRANWQPPSFYRIDLSGRDFSRRYLGRVDLREAQLVGTSFYMADLSGACLAGANLSQANLSAANLSGADLRYATLADTNLLVTDLHNAVLLGANLLGARHLTPQQIYSTIYDGTTQLDRDVEVTLPRIPTISPTKASAKTVPAPATITQMPAEPADAVSPQISAETVDTVPNAGIEPADTVSSQTPVETVDTAPIALIEPAESLEELEHARPIEPLEETEYVSPFSLVDMPPETPQPVTLPEISPLLDQEQFEPFPLSPFPLNDSSLELAAARVPEIDTPEEEQADKQGAKAASRPRYNSKRREKLQ